MGTNRKRERAEAIKEQGFARVHVRTLGWEDAAHALERIVHAVELDREKMGITDARSS